MADDIVKRLYDHHHERNHGEIALPTGLAGMFTVGCQRCEAAAEIERLRAEVERKCVQCVDETTHQAKEIIALRAERDAIDALHQPDPEYYSPRDRQMCLNCDLEWPCPTYELLHHQDAHRG